MSEWKALFSQQKKLSSLSAEKKISISQKEKINGGEFVKCKSCNFTVPKFELKNNSYICNNCGNHFRIDSSSRIELIFDKDSVEYFDSNMISENPIEFPGYSKKIDKLNKDLNLSSAVITGCANILNIKVCFGVIDYRYMMGSMGSVEGEKLTRMIEKATDCGLPIIIFSSSGGARIHEGMVSLYQMAKVAASIKRHSKEGNLYISVVTDPTTGGVNASFASIGDIIIAEPNATVGFAGKRVVKQTMNETLPEKFQTSEFMLERGFIDIIISRENLKHDIYHIIRLHDKNFISEIKTDIKFIESKNIEYNASISEDDANINENDVNINENDVNINEIDVNIKRSNFTSWQKVKIARDSKRPNYNDYIKEMIDGFIELHGDRAFKDDKAMIGGIGYLNDIAVTVICTAKGKNLNENVYRNFGMSHPEGYRKALRLMKQAEKFNRPILCLIDTPGAFCGIEAEERGQGEAIAKCLMDISDISVPIISVITGEGGSGGALALAIGDYTYMLENSIYSVISPEGAAAIVLKDSIKAEQISEYLKFTAKDLLVMGIIDEIVEEPYGGIQNDPVLTIKSIKNKIYRKYIELYQKEKHELVKDRYERIRMKNQ